MKHGLEFVTFWSVKEGNPQLGYIAGDGRPADPTTTSRCSRRISAATTCRAPRSSTAPTSPHVKAFAARDVDQTVVIDLEQDETDALQYTVRLDSGAVSGRAR